MTNKICRLCGVAKPVEDFGKEKKGMDGLRSECKSCHSIKKRENHLKRRYGLTVKQYDNMLKRQHYGCRICGSQCQTGRRLAVDHCHKSGQIRGLLCNKCNKGLGYFNDDINRMNLAAQYLTCSGEWLPGLS